MAQGSPPRGTARVIAFPGPGLLRPQAVRRRIIRLGLADAKWWIEQGLRGAITLEEAVYEAYISLGAVGKEVSRASLS